MLAAKRRTLILWATVAIVWVGLLILVTLNSGLRSGVGLFSIFSALHLAEAKTAAIDVDAGSFQAPLIGMVGLIVVGIAAALRTTPNRLSLLITTLATIVVGAYIDGRFGPDMIARLMSARGYERCRAADYSVHSFRSTTFFENYVASAGNCRPDVKRKLA